MRPHFNVEGGRTSLYCKEHAGDHMLNVVSKRCSHNFCTKFPSFNVECEKVAAFCKQRAEDGVVDVRARSSLPFPGRTVPARGVKNIVNKSASTMLDSDLLDDSNIHDRKRRCTKQPHHSLGHGPLKGELDEHAGIGSSIEVSPSFSSRAFRSEVTDKTVGTAAKQTRTKVPEVLPPYRDEHHTEVAIKTDMELVVVL